MVVFFQKHFQGGNSVDSDGPRAESRHKLVIVQNLHYSARILFGVVEFVGLLQEVRIPEANGVVER